MENPQKPLAEGAGFEPTITESKSVVLPLHYPPIYVQGGVPCTVQLTKVKISIVKSS